MLTVAAIAILGLQVTQLPATPTRQVTQFPSDKAKAIISTTYGSRPIRFITHVTESSNRDTAQTHMIETVFRSPQSFKIDSTSVTYSDLGTRRSRSVMWADGDTIRMWNQNEGEKALLGTVNLKVNRSLNKLNVRYGSPLPSLFHRMLFDDYSWFTPEYQVNQQMIVLVESGRISSIGVRIDLPQERFPITERLVMRPMNRVGSDGWSVNTMHTFPVQPQDWDKALAFTPPKD